MPPTVCAELTVQNKYKVMLLSTLDELSSKGGRVEERGEGREEEREGGEERREKEKYEQKWKRRLKDPWTLAEGREESPFCIELSTCFTAIVWASSLEKLSGEQTT